MSVHLAININSPKAIQEILLSTEDTITQAALNALLSSPDQIDFQLDETVATIPLAPTYGALVDLLLDIEDAALPDEIVLEKIAALDPELLDFLHETVRRIAPEHELLREPRLLLHMRVEGGELLLKKLIQLAKTQTSLGDVFARILSPCYEESTPPLLTNRTALEQELYAAVAHRCLDAEIPRSTIQSFQDERLRFAAALEFADLDGGGNVVGDFDLTEDHNVAVIMRAIKHNASFGLYCAMENSAKFTEREHFAIAREALMRMKYEDALWILTDKDRYPEFSFILLLLGIERLGGVAISTILASSDRLMRITQEGRVILAIEAIKNNSLSYDAIQNYGIEDAHALAYLKNLHVIVQMQEGASLDSEQVYADLRASCATFYPLHLLARELLENPPANKRALYQQLLIADALFNLGSQEIPLSPEHIDLLHECASYPNYRLAKALTEVACRVIPDYFDNYQHLADKVHMHLFMLFFAEWGATIEEMKTFKFFLEQRSLRKELRDAKRGALQRLLNTMQSLTKADLTNEERVRLLTYCVQLEGDKPVTSAEFFSRLSLLGALVVFRKEPELTRLQGFRMTEGLTHLMISALQESVDIGEVEDFAKRYDETFGSMRMPHAILTYITRLKLLPDNFTPPLKRLICGVLNGTFIEERYEPTTEHLKRLHDEAPQVYARWRESPQPEVVKIEGLLNKREMSGKLWVSDTDHPEDVLLCGTEVMGSCLRIDGDPVANQGLLGSLLDGKIRVAVIKDQEGRIVARAILKLLWSQEGPVLFQERIYPNSVDSDLERALNHHVEARARQMNIPLFRGKGEVTLSSFGSRAPEYEDGGVGLSQTGYYTIQAQPFLPESKKQDYL